MRVSLLYKDHAMDWRKKKSGTHCYDDLKFEVLLETMSRGSKEVYGWCSRVMEESLQSEEEILYRQAVMKDCIRNAKVVKQLYEIADSAVKEIVWNRSYVLINDEPSVVIDNAIQRLGHFLQKYTKIRKQLNLSSNEFSSEGFLGMIQGYRETITKEFVEKVDSCIRYFEKMEQVEVNVSTGVAFRATGYQLCKKERLSLSRFSASKDAQRLSVNPSNTELISQLLELKQRGLEETADILACAADEMKDYFLELQKELAFYCGGIQLYQELSRFGCPISFPKVCTTNENQLNFQELYDVGLALSQQKKVVGNTLNLNGCRLILITGANQGGKSTFLRSIGIAQMMFQAGLFVGASYYESSLYQGLYTHFRKDEDMKMNRGKLSDELKRFNDISKEIRNGAVLMCNESFSSTNEKEGSEIAIPILNAFADSGIRVFMVTHFYTLPKYYEEQFKDGGGMILQAERKEDATRSYRMVQKPLEENSYALDLYQQLFEE